jgi:hypothetical protein
MIVFQDSQSQQIIYTLDTSDGLTPPGIHVSPIRRPPGGAIRGEALGVG